MFGVQGLGMYEMRRSTAQGCSGFMVLGSGLLGVQGLGFRVRHLGFRDVQGCF